MADELPNSHYYNNLGGINQKASKYEMSTAQFLDLRNVDFDVPNALQKRPGSSLWMASPLSGPVISLAEFQKLLTAGGQTPNDWILVNANGNVYQNTPQAATNPTTFSLMSSGWGTTQPVDFLTFVNKAWMANGQQWQWFDGTTTAPVGLPKSIYTQTYNGVAGATYTYLFDPFRSNVGAGISYMLVNGATMLLYTSNFIAKSIYVAYSYIRNDGYQGPADFQNTARNIVMHCPPNVGEDVITNSTQVGGLKYLVAGFTIPSSSYGLSGIAVWFAEDTISSTYPLENIPGIGQVYAGKMGWRTQAGAGFYGSATLKPNADLTRFWLYTIMPTSQLGLVADGSGGTYYAMTMTTFNSTFGAYDGVPPASLSFSGMAFDYFASYIPKYIEVNQNMVFAAGYSSSPSRVDISDLGLPENYQVDNNFEVRTNDGDRIFGLKAYNNQVIIAKEHSFAKAVGNSPDNLQLVELSEEFGCISNRTMITKDQTCFWLDRKGILEYNGANWKIISDPVEGIFRRMNLSAAKEMACGIHHIYRNQIWWGIPVDGSLVNNITVVFDYLIGGWTFFDGYNPASFAYVQGQLTKPTVWRGDFSGSVHFTGESFYNDSSVGITCLAFTRFENVGGENQTTLWRRMFLDAATASGITGQIKGQLFTNYNTSTVQATFSTFQDLYQYRVEFGVQGKAIAAQISHNSASLPLLINGYGFANRGLRNV